MKYSIQLTITLVVIIAIIGGGLFYLNSIAAKIATSKDAQDSHLIYDAVFAESQNAGLPIAKGQMFSNPRRGKTDIIVGASLTDKEKQALTGIVDRIAGEHPDQKISLHFK